MNPNTNNVTFKFFKFKRLFTFVEVYFMILFLVFSPGIYSLSLSASYEKSWTSKNVLKEFSWVSLYEWLYIYWCKSFVHRSFIMCVLYSIKLHYIISQCHHNLSSFLYTVLDVFEEKSYMQENDYSYEGL